MSDAEQNNDPKVIDASPTKDLFINMLIRDLTIEDAIGDLVDNCIDGAKSLSNNKVYKGLNVDIKASKTGFTISDNCGGISVHTARMYAFRFGRKESFDRVSKSVGNFGIGMKRALFKLGRKILIQSTAKTSQFTLNVDVDKWRESDKWEFEFTHYSENTKVNKREDRGTKIMVTDLHSDVAAQFGNPKFINKLKNEIELENLFNIHNGITININGEKLTSKELSFLQSADMKTAYFEKDYNVNDNNINVKIYAGIGEDEFEDGGWYIFCNDRLILGKDQSPVTGWGDGAAKYHGQYQRFRGLVFFESDNADVLPWNTTKNGLDKTSSVFQNTRIHMISMMNEVNSYLNKIKDERTNDNPKTNWVLYNRTIENAGPIPISNLEDLDTSEKFEYPKDAISKHKKTSTETTVRFNAPKVNVNKAKKYFNVTTNGEAGRHAFDYFVTMELD